MKNLEINTDPKVEAVFNNYPDGIKEKLLYLRTLILETAEDLENISQLEETLKWGEPSYITKIGSTLRINWKSKVKTQYAMYFKCTSKLVATFKVIYKDTFKFEGTRAIVFNLEDKIPEEALKNCIKAALTYHKVKHLPTLGL